MRALALTFLSLAVTPATAEATRLTALLGPSGTPAPHSAIVKAGECFTTCSTGSARNDCASGQPCSSYCDSHDHAVCGIGR
jgi:hypothetical protein